MPQDYLGSPRRRELPTTLCYETCENYNIEVIQPAVMDVFRLSGDHRHGLDRNVFVVELSFDACAGVNHSTT